MNSKIESLGITENEIRGARVNMTKKGFKMWANEVKIVSKSQVIEEFNQIV